MSKSVDCCLCQLCILAQNKNKLERIVVLAQTKTNYKQIKNKNKLKTKTN